MTKPKKRNDPIIWKHRIIYLKQKLRTLYRNPWTSRTHRLAHRAKEELSHLYKKLELTRKAKGIRQ